MITEQTINYDLKPNHSSRDDDLGNEGIGMLI